MSPGHAGGSRYVIAAVLGVGAAVVPVGLVWAVLRARLVVYGLGDLVSQLGAGQPMDDVSLALPRLLDDPSVQLLARTIDGGFVDRDGRPAALPAPGSGLAWQPIGEPAVGALVFAEHTAPDPRVLAAVGGAVKLVLEHVRLQDQLRAQLTEVQASRARVVAAADSERRRIERDLHDGAQQHLVSSALSVHLARQSVRSDPDRAEALLSDTERQLQTALDEVRRLARGIHPAVLVDHGVGAAVESLAQRLPLAIDLRDELPDRPPSPVETAAYFVACEALVNVTKHADVDAAAVRMWQDGSTLLVQVSDRGVGGTDPQLGSGLRGLSDRLAALGGTLSITTSTGTGTDVLARLPVDGSVPR